MSYLELKGLTVRYGTVNAVDNFNLSVTRGEFVSLLGPSGCGKTTTLQTIAGFVEASAGSIVLDGKDLTGIRPAKRNLGIVFQNYALFPHMTVAANVGFGLEMRGVAQAERKQRVSKTLNLVGLQGFADRLPRRLSGGQQQRVALARALAIEPRLLLLDEPLSNLDSKLREEMQAELSRIQHEIGTTTIMVTHDQGEALALSDRVVLMRQGRIEQTARPREIYDRPMNDFVAGFLGRANNIPAVIKKNGVGYDVAFDDYAIKLANADIVGPAVARLRPERIRFAQSGLRARVSELTFHGHHWFIHVDTSLGRIGIMTTNRGERPPEVDSVVHLAWDARDFSLGPRESA